MCVDFKDLNKASAKDDFSLPHIDILVDNSARHALLSFMDGYAGYNEVKMAVGHRKDYLYYPLGKLLLHCDTIWVKNIKAACQGTATTMLHDLIHKGAKVYVNDIIISPRKGMDMPYSLQVLYQTQKIQYAFEPTEVCIWGNL